MPKITKKLYIVFEAEPDGGTITTAIIALMVIVIVSSGSQHYLRDLLTDDTSLVSHITYTYHIHSV